MLALQLNQDTVKPFMGKLLREDIFDTFHVRSIDITTNIQININGQLAPEGEAKAGFTLWESLRPLVYEIIKQSPKPKQVKIVFSHPSEETIHPNAKALFLNLTYENDNVYFTTGTAQKEFTMEKSLDQAWDDWVKGFLQTAKLVVAERE